jgi:hypothetical protein
MKPFSIIFLWVLLGNFVLFNANAQVRFSAMAAPGNVAAGEFLQYKMIIENATDVKNLVAPSFKQFAVMGGPSTMNGETDVNGRTTQYIIIGFILKPLKKGKFTIGSASVELNGKSYRTEPIVITVRVAGSPAKLNPSNPDASIFKEHVLRKGESIKEKINNNMFLKLETDYTSCYEGEPIVASYKLFTRMMSDGSLEKSPGFNGFSVIDMKTDEGNEPRTATVNGKNYNVYVIRKAQLYPLHSGTINIEPAELENRQQLIKEEYLEKSGLTPDDLSEQVLMTLPADAVVNYTATLVSQPMLITVKPLPMKGKPAGFNGAVGDFTIRISSNELTFPLDESGMLQVTISGKGNLHLVTFPVINWLSVFDDYEPVITDSIDKQKAPLSGMKKMVTRFSATRTGTFILAPLQFSFFNPFKEQYETVETDSIRITITPPAKRSKVDKTERVENKSTDGINVIFNHRRLLVAALAFLLAVILFFWWRKDKSKEKQLAVTTSATEMQEIVKPPYDPLNAFPESTKCLKDAKCDRFYQLIQTEYRQLIARHLKMVNSGLTRKDIILGLRASSIPVELQSDIRDLLDEIEQQLYSPMGGDLQKENLFNRAEELNVKIQDHFS